MTTRHLETLRVLANIGHDKIVDALESGRDDAVAWQYISDHGLDKLAGLMPLLGFEVHEEVRLGEPLGDCRALTLRNFIPSSPTFWARMLIVDRCPFCFQAPHPARQGQQRPGQRITDLARPSTLAAGVLLCNDCDRVFVLEHGRAYVVANEVVR